jgi:hypothetical protein
MKRPPDTLTPFQPMTSGCTEETARKHCSASISYTTKPSINRTLSRLLDFQREAKVLSGNSKTLSSALRQGQNRVSPTIDGVMWDTPKFLVATAWG